MRLLAQAPDLIGRQRRGPAQGLVAQNAHGNLVAELTAQQTVLGHVGKAASTAAFAFAYGFSS